MPVALNAEKKLIVCTRKSVCKRMDEYLAPEANARQKGLVLFVVTDLVSGKNSVKGVVYKKKSGDRGFLLNFCPFCGENLYALYEVSSGG